MKIIISPAKRMRLQTDFMEKTAMPAFLEEADRIRTVLKGYSEERLQSLYMANASITRLNYERLQTMDLKKGLTPAVLAYVGLQYQSMAPDIFTRSQWEYVNKHLRIVSGFYGVLRACDGVVPYRLEMQSSLSIDGKQNLYEFWGSRLYEALTEDGDSVIVNLASKEYSKAIEPWVKKPNAFITCVFGREEAGKIKVRATAAKITRGEMVRYLAENGVETPEGMKEFSALGYRYLEKASSDEEFVFVNEG